MARLAGTSMRPPSGLSRPASSRSRVLLPQPEGPSRTTSSSSSILEIEVVQNGAITEPADDLLDEHAGLLARRGRSVGGGHIAS